MPSQLILEITDGPLCGTQFSFDQHDILLFGRHSQCHARLRKDRLVSRHHFLLEVNPPQATLRDLGSRNGTYVNGVRYGGRALDETPQQGSARTYPEVGLKPGDRVTVGNTTIEIRLKSWQVCSQCGAEAAAEARAGELPADDYVCPQCQLLATTPFVPAAALVCSQCGKELMEPAPAGAGDDYVCLECRVKLHRKPAGLEELLNQAKRGGRGARPLSIPGYDVHEVLGKGGMGIVYRATRLSDQLPVAVKVMLPSVAVHETARRRFLREIEVVQQLHHPHLVSLLDHGSVSGAFFFVMEHCSGGSIDRLVKSHGGKLPLEVAGPIMLQCLLGLEHAHAARFVHRDLKPQNILLDQQRESRIAKISDFGLAKSLEQAGLSGMTATGSTGGTYAFMPREQLTDFKRVEPVSDVWSIAATFYCLLTGSHPRRFTRGRDPIEVILQDDAVPLRERDANLPAALAEVIDRALDNAPNKRFADAGAMRKALEAVL